MILPILAATAAISMHAHQPNYTRESVRVSSQSIPTYSFPGADQQQVVNGRLYKGRVIMGGVEQSHSAAAYAAASYGAAGDEALRVQADVEGLFRFHPTTTVEFSPWTPVGDQQASPYSDSYSRAHQKMARRAEEARQQWLKDNNYVGGVRTFVNDAAGRPARPRTELPKPRGTIQLAPEVPAFKSRMHVQAPSANVTRVAGTDVVKVLPQTTVVASK